jgi:hypothetical protein
MPAFSLSLAANLSLCEAGNTVASVLLASGFF